MSPRPKFRSRDYAPEQGAGEFLADRLKSIGYLDVRRSARRAIWTDSPVVLDRIERARKIADGQS